MLLANFKDKFALSIESCFVEDYRLVVQDDDLSYSDYSGSDIYLDSSNNLVFSTLSPLSVTLFIEASNPSAGSHAYLPVYLTVTNFAPYFVEGPPSNI